MIKKKLFFCNSFDYLLKRLFQLSLIMFLLSPVFGWAATETFYLTATGAGTKSGTSLANAMSPTEFNTAFNWDTDDQNDNKIGPNDAVLLFDDDGDIDAQLVIQKSGLKGKPITIKAGHGENPVIIGGDEVTGWSLYSGNIYQASLRGATYQVFYDEDWMLLAHEPDNDYYSCDGNSTSKWKVKESNWGLTNSQVAGADLFVRPSVWFWLGYRINSYSASNDIIYLTKDGRISDSSGKWPSTGEPYYIANKLWMLDTAGEWFHDTGTNTVYVWCMRGADPSAHTIYASIREFGIYANEKDYITIDGLTIKYTGSSGIFFDDCVSFSIQNCDISYCGGQKYYNGTGGSESTGYGIFIRGRGDRSGEGGTINGNTLYNIARSGIYIKDTNNVMISGNTVLNVGLVGKDEYCPRGGGKGIILDYHSNTCIIKNNEIENTGSTGIQFFRTTIVKNNYINKAMQVLDDGGGIYCWGQDADGSTIIDNVINNTGTKSGNTQGIYLDDGSDRVSVTNNSVQVSRRGIFLHNTRNCIVTSNTIYDVRQGILIKEDSNNPYDGYSTGNIINNNQIFIVEDFPDSPRYASDYCINYQGWRSHLNMASTIDNNIYSSNDPDDAFFFLFADAGIWKYTHHDSFSQWQNEMDQNGMALNFDQNSTFITQQGSVDPYEDSLFLINPGPNTKRFQYSDYSVQGKSYVDFNGNPVTWPVFIDGYSSKILVWDGGESEDPKYVSSPSGLSLTPKK